MLEDIYKFKTLKMSVQELLSNIYSQKETSQTSLEMFYYIFERLETEPIFVYTQLTIFTLQMQPKAMSVSDISLFRLLVSILY